MKNKLAINIVTYNALDILKTSLENLAWVQNDKNVEIFILDNNSSDKNVEYIKSNYPWINLVESKINTGFGFGHVKLWEECREFDPEYVLIMNPDLLITKSDIEELLAAYSDKNKNLGVVGPRIVDFDGHLERSILNDLDIKFYFKKVLGLLEEEDDSIYNNESLVPGVTGACMLVNTKVIKEIGLFDKDIFFYVEDNDFCYRVRKAGYKILFLPTVEVKHALSKSTESFANPNLWRKKNLYLSTMVYFRKNRPYYEFAMLWVGRIVEMMVRIVIGKERVWAKEMLPLILNHKYYASRD